MAGLGVCIKTELLEEGVRGVETGQTGGAKIDVCKGKGVKHK